MSCVYNFKFLLKKERNYPLCAKIIIGSLGGSIIIDSPLKKIFKRSLVKMRRTQNAELLKGTSPEPKVMFNSGDNGYF